MNQFDATERTCRTAVVPANPAGFTIAPTQLATFSAVESIQTCSSPARSVASTGRFLNPAPWNLP